MKPVYLDTPSIVNPLGIQRIKNVIWTRVWRGVHGPGFLADIWARQSWAIKARLREELS